MMMHKYLRLLVGSAFLFLLAGGQHIQTAAAGQETETENSDVKLTAGTWQDVKALIARHPGKVVVVDVWSTSCLPCMKEFPNLIKLQRQHADAVVCVSLNVDYVGIRSRPPERYREKVETFLVKQEAKIPNILCTQPADELFEELKLNSIPAVYVFGPDGKQARRFDSSMLTDGKEEAFTYDDDINPFVAGLISRAK
jgi:thiol-disulfide isomerase/thioredoxin